MITVDLKVTGLKDLSRQLERDRVMIAAATASAINDTAKAVQTAASREIRAKFNLNTERVNREVKQISTATRSNLSAVIQAKGRPIGLTNFGASWVRGTRVTTAKMSKVTKRIGRNQGVNVTIQKGKRTNLPHAFIARAMRGKVAGAGALQVFQRRDLTRWDSPLINRAAVTIATMMQQVQDKIIRRGFEQFDKRFDHHFKRLVARSQR